MYWVTSCTELMRKEVQLWRLEASNWLAELLDPLFWCWKTKICFAPHAPMLRSTDASWVFSDSNVEHRFRFQFGAYYWIRLALSYLQFSRVKKKSKVKFKNWLQFCTISVFFFRCILRYIASQDDWSKLNPKNYLNIAPYF